jgi:hypothetical protein
MTTNPFSCCFAFMAVLGVANAQNLVATSSSGETTTLVPHPVVATFVASNSNNLAGALGGRAVSTAAVKAVPIPVVGGFVAEQAVGRIGKVLHKPKPTLGFNIAFIQGLTAGTALQKGEISFTFPVLQGASALLLRLKPSVKDAARVVRSVHISNRLTGGTLNPVETTILGVDQDEVACRQETRDGNVVLIPIAPLESGEYAIVLVSTEPDKVPVASFALWDFRLL